MRQARPVALSPKERRELDRWVASRAPSDRLAIRARVILHAALGRTNGEIARSVGVHPETVARWRRRFLVNRTEGLRRDAPRSGARTRQPSPLADRILRATREQVPPDGGRWTTRSLARALQVNHMLVHRVWKAHGISPSAPVDAGRSGDDLTWIDLVGLYLDTPAAAVVFALGRRPAPSDEPPAHPRIDSDRASDFLLRDLPGSVRALDEVLARAEDLVPSVPDLRRPPSELLVFLRNLEEKCPQETALQLILDRPLESVSERLASWLRSHPRFRLRTAVPGGTWSAAVYAWLNEFRSMPLHPESLRGFEALSHVTGRLSTVRGRAKGQFSWAFTEGLRRGGTNERPSTLPYRSA